MGPWDYVTLTIHGGDDDGDSIHVRVETLAIIQAVGAGASITVSGRQIRVTEAPSAILAAIKG